MKRQTSSRLLLLLALGIGAIEVGQCVLEQRLQKQSYDEHYHVPRNGNRNPAIIIEVVDFNLK
jgi:hypothetical protein